MDVVNTTQRVPIRIIGFFEELLFVISYLLRVIDLWDTLKTRVASGH